MPFPSETYLNLIRTLGTAVPNEFESLYAQLEGWMSTQHKDDGSHSSVTADNVTLQEDGSVTLHDGTRILVKDGIPTIEASGQDFAVETKGSATQAAASRLRFADSGIVGGGLDAEARVENAALMAQRLRFFPQSSYAASASDVTALVDGVTGPLYTVYRLTSTNSIEGIYDSSNAAGLRGQVLVLLNDSGGSVSLAPLGIVSNTRKIIGGPVTLQDDGAAVLVYNESAQGWHIISAHSPGEGRWTAVAHAGGNFTASSGDWTVDSGDQSTFAYTLVGKKMTVAFVIQGTDVSATPVTLQILIPGSFTAAKDIRNPVQIRNAGTYGFGLARVAAGDTKIYIYPSADTSATWTATSSDNTNVSGEITFEVQ